MKKLSLFTLNIFVVFCIGLVPSMSAEAPKQTTLLDISETIGFIYGQRFTLNRIKTEYPALSLRAIQVEHKFSATFGIAEKNIEKLLRGILKEEYPEYIVALKHQISSTLNTQQINQDFALQFLDEVESRSQGEIPSPILETLLNYQFEKWPADELIRGFKTIYRTNGHRKAKGLDLQIEYAKSWSKREGKRPNVIQFFKSNNGRGFAFASIMVRDLLKDAQENDVVLTREEIDFIKTRAGSNELASESFSENNIRAVVSDMGMTNVRNTTTKRMVLDSWPGVMVEFIGEGQRLDFNFTMHNRMYIAIYKNYIIFLNCQVGKSPNETINSLKAKAARFAPLFHFMANSLVIQSQY